MYVFIDIVIIGLLMIWMNLNWMSVYVLYDIVSIFVNDVGCDWDYPCYRILTLLVIGIIDEDD